MSPNPALIEARGLSKRFGTVSALENVSLRVEPGQIMCLLGDNGAGKSTLIKLLCGVHQPDSGTIAIEGEDVRLRSPRDALDRGIATVFQDLGMIPLMSVARNFCLGQEPIKGRGPFAHIDGQVAVRVAREGLERIGIELDDMHRTVATLSGGQRQSVAIARAAYFGAKALILDEPTSALGVREAALVLKHTAKARDRGVGIVFITHNVHHALAVGDHFTVLAHGRNVGTFAKGEVTRDDLETLMAGDREIERFIDLDLDLGRSEAAVSNAAPRL